MSTRRVKFFQGLRCQRLGVSAFFKGPVGIYRVGGGGGRRKWGITRVPEGMEGIQSLLAEYKLRTLENQLPMRERSQEYPRALWGIR